jgi:hypothetical protein
MSNGGSMMCDGGSIIHSFGFVFYRSLKEANSIILVAQAFGTRVMISRAIKALTL